MSVPRFNTRAELDHWSQAQLGSFMADAPYARNQVQLMLQVASRIRRAHKAHEHLLETAG
jgi:hypothetical protein